MFTDRDVLTNSGKVSANTEIKHADSEFEKYRMVQNRLFESDFDQVLKALKDDTEK